MLQIIFSKNNKSRVVLICSTYKQCYMIAFFCKPNTKLDIKIPLGTPPQKSGRGSGSGVLIFLIKVFSSKFLILAYGGARRRQKSALDFLSTIWQHITTVSFGVSFNFCFVQEAQKSL